MAKVNDVIALMQKIAPEEKVYAKDYDNVGLMVGDKNARVAKVICCLDVTNAVIAEARSENAQMIISHHPLIYGAVSSVTSDTVVGQKIFKLIQNGIAVYSAHTNLDFCSGGINEYAAKTIGLEDIEPLDPYIDGGEGLGRIGLLKQEVACFALLNHVKKCFSDPFAALIGEDKPVRKIAIINGGAGGDTSYVDMAIKAGADCLITGDVKHHVAIYAIDKGFVLIEAQHFATEYHYITRLAELLGNAAKRQKINIDIIQSKSEKSPKRQELL